MSVETRYTQSSGVTGEVYQPTIEEMDRARDAMGSVNGLRFNRGGIMRIQQPTVRRTDVSRR